MDLKVNECFRELIPPLTAEEYKQLEENILAEGCRDALVVWGNIIVDGHNRHEICTMHGVEFETKQKEFESEEDVKVWIIYNQFGRRNLTPYQRGLLALKLEDCFKQSASANLRTHTKQGYQNSDKAVHVNKEVAAVADLSHDTISRIKKIESEAMPTVLAKARSGEISINQAYKDVQKEQRKKEIQEERKQIAEKAQQIFNTDKWSIEQANIENWQAPRQYDFIITDPPYPKEYLYLYGVLAKRANEWLKPGGAVVAMCGQSYLNEIYEMMSKHLEYYWTACYLTPGQPTPLRQVNVNTTWKPLLIFKRHDEKYAGKIFGDVFKSDGNDKDFHKWGQSISGMTDILSRICLQWQYILDPFCGAGTTGIAALNHGCLFDGIDIDIENVNISRGRLHDTQA